MNSDLMKAILALDSYNRGYNEGVIKPSTVGDYIGNARFIRDKADTEAKNAGFYAVVYDYNGEKIISYRGTDSHVIPRAGEGGSDIVNGYGIANGRLDGKQALLAFKFYNEVATLLYGHPVDPRNADISFTGH